MVERLKTRRAWRFFRTDKMSHFSSLCLFVSERNKDSTDSPCTSFCHCSFLLLLISQQMSERCPSQGRSFWLESHQVTGSPAVSLTLSLEKPTLQLIPGLKCLRMFKIMEQKQNSNCSDSRVSWEHRKSQTKAHPPNKHCYQLLCLSCTEWHKGRELCNMLPFGV